MNVLCVDDKNLPQGASVKEGKEYEVIEQYINGMEQRVYIIKGIVNEGRTQFGLHWIGYKAERFVPVDTKVIEIHDEHEMYV
jgi:hypothetical protein